MPKVNVQTHTSLAPKDSFEKVKSILESDQDLHKMDSNYVCEFDGQNLSGHAKGKLFKAFMNVYEESNGSKVEITVDLPLALALAKGTIKKTLQNKLDKALS